MTFERRLTVFEYLFSCAGTSRTKFAYPDIILVLEGDGGPFDTDRWQTALDRASATNPGSHLRLAGRLWWSHWRNDGARPVLRLIERVDWDGQSSDGDGFIRATPLPLETGPTVELILVNDSPRGPLVILRTPHAVMDARGALFFLGEIFRALRNEIPHGSTIRSDGIDRRRLKALGEPPSRAFTGRLTGAPDFDQSGFEWKRVSLATSGSNILGRLAAVLAEYMHRQTDLPAIFALPVDLRRHAPGLLTTANTLGPLFVPVEKGEDAADFRQKLQHFLQNRMELYRPRGASMFKMVKAIPRSAIERSVVNSLRPSPQPKQTAVLSNVGRLSARDYSCEAFESRSCFIVPVSGITLFVLSGMGEGVEIVVTMPKCLSSGGRMDALLQHLRERLTA